MRSLGEVVNNAMSLIEEQSEQLVGILPKSYTDFADGILSELLRILTILHWMKWEEILSEEFMNIFSISL